MFSRQFLKLFQRPVFSVQIVRTMCSTASESTRPVRLEYPGKVRLGFLPEEWFQFFYNKTGVTGPYTFGVGLLTYLISKEIYVLEHEYYTGLSLAILATYVVKKFGPMVAAYCDKEIDKIENEWENSREMELKSLEVLIENEKKEQWRAEGNLILMEAKKENIDLQLEIAYRERIAKVYNDVRHYLDYYVECHNIEKRLGDKNRVNWIVKNVISSIEKQSDKETLKKAYADLTALAAQIK